MLSTSESPWKLLRRVEEADTEHASDAIAEAMLQEGKIGNCGKGRGEPLRVLFRLASVVDMAAEIHPSYLVFSSEFGAILVHPLVCMVENRHGLAALVGFGEARVTLRASSASPFKPTRQAKR